MLNAVKPSMARYNNKHHAGQPGLHRIYVVEMERKPAQYIYILTASLVYCLIVVLGVGLYRISEVPMLSKTQQPILIEYKKNTSATQLVHALQKQQLLDNGSLLLALIRYQGVSHQLHAGIYQILPGETPLQFIHKVTLGDVLKQKITIVEGTTQRQVIEQLKHAPYLSYAKDDWTVIPSGHESDEGLLLADTYQYEAGSSSRALIRQANLALTEVLNQAWAHRDPNVPYKSPYELLVAASILEKETSSADERKIISGVIMNRINKHMRLQVDPTVIYALGEQYSGKLTRKGLKIDSPYNTYKYRGLPPTPIAMVSRSSIYAAANPEHHQYIYFVAKGDGTHEFSRTYEEQKQAIKKYL